MSECTHGRTTPSFDADGTRHLRCTNCCMYISALEAPLYERITDLQAQVAEVTDLVVQGHQLGVTTDDGQYRYIPKDYWDAIIKVLDRPTASEDG